MICSNPDGWLVQDRRRCGRIASGASLSACRHRLDERDVRPRPRRCEVRAVSRRTSSSAAALYNCAMTFQTLGLLTFGFCAGAAAHVALVRAQSRAAIADAPLAVPDIYKVELENEYVCVVRVRYPAHASGAMHAHPAPGALIVPLTDQDARRVSIALHCGLRNADRGRIGQGHPSPGGQLPSGIGTNFNCAGSITTCLMRTRFQVYVMCTRPSEV